jgi:Domain of unknown function (DUF4382)
MLMTLSLDRFKRGCGCETWRDFFSAVIFAAVVSTVALQAGCTNFCLTGVSNNGNGTVGVTLGNPPPACSLGQANGTVRVLAVKSAACEACTAAARLEHVFVTLRGIQVHPSALADADSADWVELVPELRREPRQIDLMGGAVAEILGESATIPAGNYRQIRLQFLAQDSEAAGGEKFESSGSCGTTRSNCVVRADGFAEPLHFSSAEPELRITGEQLTENPLVVWPDARIDLRLRLQANEAIRSSFPERWEPQSELVGTAASGPQTSPE